MLSQQYPPERMEVDRHRRDVRRRDARDRPANGRGGRAIQLLDNPRRIAPTAMNLGTAARGEVLIRVDGHCEIDPSYVRRCVEHLERDSVDGVGGPVTTIGETPLSERIAIAMSSRFGVGTPRFAIVTDRTIFGHGPVSRLPPAPSSNAGPL